MKPGSIAHFLSGNEHIHILDLICEVHSIWVCGQVAFDNTTFLLGRACGQKHKPSFEKFVSDEDGPSQFGHKLSTRPVTSITNVEDMFYISL